MVVKDGKWVLVRVLSGSFLRAVTRTGYREITWLVDYHPAMQCWANKLLLMIEWINGQLLNNKTNVHFCLQEVNGHGSRTSFVRVQCCWWMTQSDWYRSLCFCLTVRHCWRKGWVCQTVTGGQLGTAAKDVSEEETCLDTGSLSQINVRY